MLSWVVLSWVVMATVVVFAVVVVVLGFNLGFHGVVVFGGGVQWWLPNILRGERCH